MKKTKNFIPEKFLFSHDYCFFLHDQLAGNLISGEKENIFTTRIQYRDESQIQQIEGKIGKAFCNWLEENGYEYELHSSFRKIICKALLVDLCHFIYEALKCSEKGKLAITYALLRKPFKENLLLLEWLLAYPDEFMECFISSPSQMPFIGSVKASRKKEIIAEAMDKTCCVSFTPEFIYKLRYESRENFSFDRIWNKAIHLITKFDFTETEEQNLNFVFSGDEDRESQWEHLYSFLPILLFHTFQIVNALLSTFTLEAQENRINELRSLNGMLLWLQSGPWHAKLSDIEDRIAQDITEGDMICPNCNCLIPLDQSNQRLIYEKAMSECRQCHYRINLYKQ